MGVLLHGVRVMVVGVMVVGGVVSASPRAHRAPPIPELAHDVTEGEMLLRCSCCDGGGRWAYEDAREEGGLDLQAVGARKEDHVLDANPLGRDDVIGVGDVIIGLEEEGEGGV